MPQQLKISNDEEKILSFKATTVGSKPGLEAAYSFDAFLTLLFQQKTGRKCFTATQRFFQCVFAFSQRT